ncbi:ATP synthase F1 subunit delta [Aeoliella sp. ICT_H6.2]|uniref:ATP synthase subunit delta n=1 Tax=Aeoliella straminimaris TaxID=2954799 RepID=A0A9X2JL50_9BACT|nr:ATP synthase F1 subunit delta [Aeoliella straminimaris]MCO6048149.1 ATP synthase F1 subunit delta [Aeoliella straminimaris]
MQPHTSTELTSAETVFDVDQEQLARTYAKAFLAATESMDQEGLLEELHSLVVDVLEKFPDFNFNLTSNFLSHEEREDLIDAVLGSRASAPVVNLLKILSRNGRPSMLRPVIRTIRKLHGEKLGRHEVRVYVPHELSSDLQEGLQQALQSRLGVTADFHFHLKPELIGGMVVQVGDTVFDGSVRMTLERARQKMVMQAIEAIETRPDSFFVDSDE